MENIVELRIDSPEFLKGRIETLLTEKKNLMEINTYLKKHDGKLSSDLSTVTKFVQMLNTSKSNLDDIMKMGQPSSSHRGPGFQSSYKPFQKIVFVYLVKRGTCVSEEVIVEIWNIKMGS